MAFVSRAAHRCATDATIWRAKISKKCALNMEPDQHLKEGFTWPKLYTHVLSKKVHNRGCSGCRSFPVVGPLYKCFHCANYFLCEACHTSSSSLSAHESGHLFVKVRHPDAVVAPMLYFQFPSKNKNRTHPATCADCGVSTLTGSRYKCRQCTTTDFSLCQRCYEKASKAKQQSPGVKRHRAQPGHDSSHDFLEILFTHNDPSSSSGASKHHDSSHAAPTWCDSCTKPITGTRFKCLNCFNYDLCEECESAEKHREGAHHYYLMIKGVPICCYNIQFLEWQELNDHTRSIIDVQRLCRV